MNILCAHHAKNADTCRWVIEQCGDAATNNLSVMSWVQACKEYLEKFSNDGADPVFD